MSWVAWPILAAIRVYQMTIGRFLPDRCRFEPSCSHYAARALRLNGPILGGAQAIWRLLRCGPWTDGGIDEPRRIDTMRRFGRDVPSHQPPSPGR